METPLTFEYDEIGDIGYIRSVLPYAKQISDEPAYDVVVRRNPETEAIEGIEILFFTRWLLRNCETDVKGEKEAGSLGELFGKHAGARKGGRTTPACNHRAVTERRSSHRDGDPLQGLPGPRHLHPDHPASI